MSKRERGKSMHICKCVYVIEHFMVAFVFLWFVCFWDFFGEKFHNNVIPVSHKFFLLQEG